MNEKIKEFLAKGVSAWTRWTMQQRLIAGFIVVVVIMALILVPQFAGPKSSATIFSAPITDEVKLSQILFKLDEEGINASADAGGLIRVDSEAMARRARALLFREQLIPKDMDPWAIFDTERWTQTDFDNDIALQRALTENLSQHIEALDDVDQARVTLNIPEKTLFTEQQDPTTVSIVVTPKPNSDLSTNRAKIQGLVSMVRSAISGLQEDNITIIDNNGVVLNNFEGTQDFDRLQIASRMLDQKKLLETKYIFKINNALQTVYPDRIQLVNMDIDLTFDNDRVEQQEITPIEIVPDDPTTPFSEQEVIENVVIGEHQLTENFTGTGFNPEGPAGQEGQTPPQYKDLGNLNGQYNRDEATKNYEINQKNTTSDKTPYQINKVSLSLVIDGVWTKDRNPNGSFIVEKGAIRRTYTPVSAADVTSIESLVQDAINYDIRRGDSVTVTTLPFDRSAEFALEDAAYIKALNQRRLAIILSLTFAGLVIIFMVIRAVILERKRRQRLKDEELMRQQALARDEALRNINTDLAPDLDYEVMSDELLEQVSALAKGNTENVASLVRTWLREDKK